MSASVPNARAGSPRPVRHRFRKALHCVVVFVGVAVAVSYWCREYPYRTPERVVRAAYRAIRSGPDGDAARFLDPEAPREFRRLFAQTREVRARADAVAKQVEDLFGAADADRVRDLADPLEEIGHDSLHLDTSGAVVAGSLRISVVERGGRWYIAAEDRGAGSLGARLAALVAGRDSILGGLELIRKALATKAITRAAFDDLLDQYSVLVASGR